MARVTLSNIVEPILATRTDPRFPEIRRSDRAVCKVGQKVRIRGEEQRRRVENRSAEQPRDLIEQRLRLPEVHQFERILHGRAGEQKVQVHPLDLSQGLRNGTSPNR
jgi:hypothetical protein